jgi:hypothetical protein
MHKTTQRLKGAVAATAIVLAALAAMFASALPAAADGPHKAAVTLKGDWQVFNRCPVDNPQMLAADGENTIALCASVDSPGVLTIGDVTLLSTEDSNTQFGAVVSNEEGSGGLENVTVVPPPGGITLAAPTQVAGGLRGLVCPGSGPILRHLCKDGLDRELNEVTGTLTNAANPAKADLPAGFMLEQPIITLTYTVRLQNPLLGRNCSIGSTEEPLIAHSENLTHPTSLAAQSFELDGTPVEEMLGGAVVRFEIKGATQGDKSLSIPIAHDCGPGGAFDQAIDNNLSLPSPSGQNSMILTSVTSFLGGLTNPGESGLPDGQQLAKDWHSAVLSPADLKGHDGGHH